jgi:putative ABC transport system permease protein
MMQAYYDFSYNRNFKQVGEIYLFSNYWKEMDRNMASISIPLAHKIVREFPEIQAACIIKDGQYDQNFQLPDAPETSFTFPLIKADEGFLTVFRPKILVGDAGKAFTEHNNILLTADVAQAIFGKENPVGKTIRQDTVNYTVVAVCERFPDNCTIINGIYTTILDSPDYEKMSWFNYSGFFRIHPEDVPALQNKFNQPEFLEVASIDRAGFIPLTAIHFEHLEYIRGATGSLSTTLSLMAIGVLIMLIAFINLMNFSVAMIPSRVRGINIQKIVGAGAGQLRIRIASEAPCFTLASFLVALFLIALFQSTRLKEFFTADLSLAKNAGLLIVLLLISMAVSVFFGLYPARRITSFQPAMALSGSFAQSKGSVFLRNILITLQFFTAIVLICIACFIQMQQRYMMNYSYGFQKDNIVYLPVHSADFVKVYENEIKQHPAVLDCTVSPDLPGAIGQNWGMDVEDRYVAFTAWIVQSNFLDFFGIPVIEGRNFIPDDDSKSRIICNRAFLEKYAFASGVGINRGEEYEFVGVMQDIHFETLHSGIRPLCLITQDVGYHYQWGNYLLIKTTGGNILPTIDYLKQAWEKLSDKPFDLHFLDDSMDRLYQKENDLAQIISIFGFITIIIAVMGVYGLIVFNARYKAKEIAIRKVNGSSIREIIVMLNRNVLFQLAVAFAIAIPVARYIVERWLENFAYKIAIHWWVFLLGGCIVLLITLITVSAQSYKAARANPTQALNAG